VLFPPELLRRLACQPEPTKSKQPTQTGPFWIGIMLPSFLELEK